MIRQEPLHKGTCSGSILILHGKLGANKGLGEAPKSCTRKEHESATNPIARRGQGGDFVPFRLPLAGSRDSVPCGAWGNAPTVPRPTNPKEAANKGADSEASLPVTLRVRRRALKLLFPQDSVKNQEKPGRSAHADPPGCLQLIVITRPARIPPLLRPQCGRRPRSPPQRCRPDGSRHARRRSLRPPRTDPQSPCRRP